jgi:thioredoxin 1
MNHPIAPVLQRESDVKERLAQQDKPLLLSFTADWCMPCKTFAPVLGALNGKHGERIDIIRVDIDACPDLARQYGVRGVPTSILLRDGTECDRFVGSKPERALVQWLVARELELLAMPEDESQSSFGAFYGDGSLQQLLTERLYTHLDAGEAQASLFPSWMDGKGSITGALVHHASPDVFERITGLPYAFGLALEFLKTNSRSEAEAVFHALAPGQDVRGAPLRLLRACLGDEELQWTTGLGSTPHDTLRREWLGLTGDLLAGIDVPACDWSRLRDTARALATGNDPYHQLEDDVVEVVTLMSPPPDAWDFATWGQSFGRASFALMRLTEHAEGWTKEDSAKPVLRERFFHKHVPLDADGGFDQQLFEAKRVEWNRDNADFVALEDACDFGKRVAHWRDLHARFQPVFVSILRGAQTA